MRVRNGPSGELLDAAARFAGVLADRGVAARLGGADVVRQHDRVPTDDARVPAARRGDAAVQRATAREGPRAAGAGAPVRPWWCVPTATAPSSTRPTRAAPVLTVPGDHDAEPPPYAELDERDPAFVLFTSGTSGEPKLVTHGQGYVYGQQLQARSWMAAEPGELVWSTAAPGWSKAARNAFLAPWLCGAAALLAGSPVRSGRAARDDPRGERERALHGADGVPVDRCARSDRGRAVAAPPDHGGRGAGRPGAGVVARRRPG